MQQANDFVTRHVTPITPVTACLSDEVPSNEGRATFQKIWFSITDGTYFRVGPRYWNADVPLTALHENLHQVALGAQLQRRDTWIEEAIVEAVTMDLGPRFIEQATGYVVSRVTPVPDYSNQVRVVRQRTAKLTHSKWTSPAARRLRVRLLIAGPELRAALLGVPR